MSAILTMWMHPHHAPSATSYPLIEFLILVCKFMHSILLWTSLSMYWLKWHRKEHKNINGNDGVMMLLHTIGKWRIFISQTYANLLEIITLSSFILLLITAFFSIWHLCDELNTTFIGTFFLDLVHWEHFFASWQEKICYLRKNWIE